MSGRGRPRRPARHWEPSSRRRLSNFVVGVRADSVVSCLAQGRLHAVFLPSYVYSARQRRRYRRKLCVRSAKRPTNNRLRKGERARGRKGAAGRDEQTADGQTAVRRSASLCFPMLKSGAGVHVGVGDACCRRPPHDDPDRPGGGRSEMTPTLFALPRLLPAFRLPFTCPAAWSTRALPGWREREPPRVVGRS